MARNVRPELLVSRENELGVERGDDFEVLLNFDFNVVMRVDFGETSGAIYEVLQQNEESRLCFVTTDDSQTSRTFVRAINKVLRTDLRCLLRDGSLGALLIKKARERRQRGPIPYKTACSILGRQPGTDTWVFGPKLFVEGVSGSLIQSTNSDLVWLDGMCPTALRAPTTQYAPGPSMPLQTGSEQALTSLVAALRAASLNNYVPSIGEFQVLLRLVCSSSYRLTVYPFPV